MPIRMIAVAETGRRIYTYVKTQIGYYKWYEYVIGFRLYCEDT